MQDKITCCPKCGSRRIYTGRMKDGVLSGYTTKSVCRDCEFQGMPIIFDSEKEYKKFLYGSPKKDKNKSSKSKKEDLNNNFSEKDKEIIRHLKEIAKEEEKGNGIASDIPGEHWHSNRSWWLEIGIALVISILIYIYGFTILTFFEDVEIIILYSLLGLLSFIIDFIIILFIIVIVEYFCYILYQTIKKFIRINT